MLELLFIKIFLALQLFPLIFINFLFFMVLLIFLFMLFMFFIFFHSFIFLAGLSFRMRLLLQHDWFPSNAE